MLTRKSTTASNTDAHHALAPHEISPFSQGVHATFNTPNSSQATLVNPEFVDLEDDEPYNPHEDAEPFLRNILRHGPRLTSSLHELVKLLRDSLPVVCAVEDIRQDALSRRRTSRPRDKSDLVVDIHVKAAGWHRVIYGDMR